MQAGTMVIDPPTDEQLAARALAGDERAFEELVGRHQERVYRLALRLTGSPADAEDVLQDTFLQVHRNLDGFRGDAKFSTWLYRVTTNAALMLLRARNRRRTDSLDEHLPAFEASGKLITGGGDLGRAARADELIERRQLGERITAALAELDDGYRTVFVLRDLEDLSTEETADLLGMTPGAVRQRLHRARLMLRGYLGNLVGGA
jgi:RNA polymerase sigma-70 factor (ECF subfamily)